MSQFWVNQPGATAGDVATLYVADVGSATPAAHILNVLGGTNANTFGSGNTLVINATPSGPNKVISEFDEFLGLEPWKLQWSNQGANSAAGTSTNPGQFAFDEGVSSSIGLVGISGPNSLGPFVLGGGTYSQNFVFDLVSLSTGGNNYTIYIGLVSPLESTIGAPPTSGVYFQYNHAVNGGNWQIVCNNGVSTTANTATLAATGFHNYGISINATGTSAAFTINGVAVANSPIATNIPLTPVSPGIISVVNAGTLPVQLGDIFYYTQVLTAAR